MERHAFYVNYKDTDLCIAVDEDSYKEEIPQMALEFCCHLRDAMDAYLITDTEYQKSLTPYYPRHTSGIEDEVREVLEHMSMAGERAGIGPMGAVAGAFNLYLAQHLDKAFTPSELIIENGGDIYAEAQEALNVSIFANTSPLSNKVGFTVPADCFPLGICTSSGTCGHSFSMGKADAVMVMCKDVLVADAMATAIANQVQTEDDVARVIETLNDDGLFSVCIIKGEKVAVKGELPLKVFKGTGL